MNLFDRLFSKVIICDNGCWEYTGARTLKGYGIISSDGQSLRAHRLAYDLVVDDIPDGMNVLHKCDNPPCINPEHLFVGNQKDNIDDMMIKGRHGEYRGSDVWWSVIDEDIAGQIKRLLNSGYPQRNIAMRFNIGIHVVKDISRGKTWKHVEID